MIEYCYIHNFSFVIVDENNIGGLDNFILDIKKGNFVV